MGDVIRQSYEPLRFVPIERCDLRVIGDTFPLIE